MSKFNSLVRELAPDPVFTDEAGASRITTLSRSWLEHARAQGIGPRFYRIGRRVVYRIDELIQYVHSNPVNDHVAGPVRKAR